MSPSKIAFAMAALISASSLAQTAAAQNPSAPKVVTGKLAIPVKDAAGKAMTGDLASGKVVFNQCMVCHDIAAGKNKVGPSLHGIIGRRAGTAPGFKYSAANKNSGITWTPQDLYVYLENPQKRIPGTFMTFTGVKNPQKRADVIAFLIANTK